MILLIVSVTLLAVGAALYLAGFDAAANGAWVADTLVGLVPAGWWVIDTARRRRMGVDAFAVLALLGTLVVGEYFAGAVITVMLATGRSLEAWAPVVLDVTARTAGARPAWCTATTDGTLTDRRIDEVAVGDLLLVQPGEVVPVDGTVESGVAVIDDSALTGEPLPVAATVGEQSAAVP